MDNVLKTVKLPCPFCGSRELGKIQQSQAFPGIIEYAVVCLDGCLCTGPTGEGATKTAARKNAVELWDTRKGESK